MGLAIAMTLSTLGSLERVVADEELYRSGDLRIVRSVDALGKPIVLLTNIDAGGVRLSGGPDDTACPPESAAPEAQAAAAPTEAPPSSGVRVIVNVSGGGSFVEGDAPSKVQVVGEGGTTVVVNVGTPGPDRGENEASPQVLYGSYPLVGLPGPFIYPSRQPFLGYGTAGAFPSLFSGLGLNAGNRFGLKTGRTCGSGYDCFFRP